MWTVSTAIEKHRNRSNKAEAKTPLLIVYVQYKKTRISTAAQLSMTGS